jgi:Flp pilus assembly protein TadG
MNPSPRSDRRQAGTAALETMVVMSFLFTLIFGFVHICMFVVTKSMTNYAAFTAARALMVGDGFGISARMARDLAARQVMSEIQWWEGGVAANTIRTIVQENQQGPRYARNVRRRGVRVSYLVPFGYPLFQNAILPVRAVGFAPTTTPHSSVREEGDNAR